MQLSFLVPQEFDQKTLQEFLRGCGVSSTLMRAVKTETDGFFADDAFVRSCDAVKAGQTVRFWLPPEPATTVQPQDIPLQIAYEDDFAMVLEKPAGMAVHPTLNYKDGTLANAYMGLLQQRSEQGVFRPVNRLDKNTSGLVLCAKNAFAASHLASSVQKVYVAILQGHLSPESGEIDAPIARAQDSIILRCVVQNGKQSCTQYATKQQTEAFSLVQAVPLTGRTHQLRVHFAHLGCPLAGDDLYGGSTTAINRHALHCAMLQFCHPITHETIAINSDLPADMATLMQDGNMKVL